MTPCGGFKGGASNQYTGAASNGGAAASTEPNAPTPGSSTRIYLGDIEVPVRTSRDHAFSKLVPGELLVLKFLSTLEAAQNNFKANISKYVVER